MRQTGIDAYKTSSSTMVGRGKDGADGSDGQAMRVPGYKSHMGVKNIRIHGVCSVLLQ
jgi:hypothetical protein